MIDFTMNSVNRQNLYEMLARLDPLRLWQVEVREKKHKRSQEQNRRYWKFLGEWAKAYGADSEYMHGLCKKKFLLIEIIEVMGEPYAITKSTPKTNTKEFAEYTEACERWAAENGFVFDWKM